MPTTHRPSVAVLFCAGTSLLFVNYSAAEGFRNPPAGAFSLARAGGRIAQIDDPSAIAHNPANIVDIPEVAVEFTPTIVYIKAEHQNVTGQSAETRDPVKFLPDFFATFPIQNEKLAVGIGVTTPFGLSNEWRKEGAFAPGGALRYSAPWYTEMMTINANPTVAYKVNDWLQIGGGADIYWSQITFKQFYPWAFFPPGGAAPDGQIRARGDGVGIGGNVGATVKITEKQRLAVVYRSAFDVDYDGTFRIDNVTPTAAAFGATSQSHFGSKVKFPNIVSAGYGIELTDNIRLETDFEWLQFSRFQSLDLDVGNNKFLFPSTSLPQNWHNTFTAGIGGDWRFAPDWTARLGYQFYESPVPDYTLSPTIPDANQHAITAGLAYKHGHHAAEVAYGYIRYDDRTITANVNPAFVGKYEVDVHLFSLAYTYMF